MPKSGGKGQAGFKPGSPSKYKQEKRAAEVAKKFNVKDKVQTELSTLSTLVEKVMNSKQKNVFKKEMRPFVEEALQGRDPFRADCPRRCRVKCNAPSCTVTGSRSHLAHHFMCSSRPDAGEEFNEAKLNVLESITKIVQSSLSTVAEEEKEEETDNEEDEADEHHHHSDHAMDDKETEEEEASHQASAPMAYTHTHMSPPLHHTQ